MLFNILKKSSDFFLFCTKLLLMIDIKKERGQKKLLKHSDDNNLLNVERKKIWIQQFVFLKSESNVRPTIKKADK